jgi:hypothetical protein
VERTRGSLVVTLPQSGKLAFLARLEPLEALIDSVRIEEPSLEEMILEATS